MARLKGEEIEGHDWLETLGKEIEVLRGEYYAEYGSEDGGEGDEDDREVFVLE